MKWFLNLIITGLTATGMAQQYPVVSMLDQGEHRIKLVFLGDGYTVSQQGVFVEDARKMLTALLLTSPFKEYKAYFNAYAIQVPSTQSGVDHPGTATDVGEPVFPVNTVNNVFNSTFDYFNIHRLVVPQNGGAIFDVLGRHIPDFDQVFVVVNSKEYGGSGGFFATSTVNELATEIAIHELGHSFAGLSDEYFAGDQYVGETANMTQETNPTKVKWKSWLNQQGVGIFQHCCGGLSSQWYKPHQNCKMQVLGPPFCLVCRERLVDRVYELVDPILSYDPAEQDLKLGEATTFYVQAIKPQPNTVKIEWWLNGSRLAQQGDSLNLQINALLEGQENILEAVYVDSTTISKSYLPAKGYVYKVDWRIFRTTTTARIDQSHQTSLKAKIYPTVVTDFLRVHLRSQENFGRYDWQIISPQGSKLMNGQEEIISGPSILSMNVQKLPPGLYYFTLQASSYPVTLAFIKE